MTTLLIGFALGMRHGTDPDHLTAIDGLSRLRPRVTNGLYFAFGHGLVVTLLAIGVGEIVAKHVAFLGPWMLIFIGMVNLVRLFRKPSRITRPRTTKRPIVGQPFLLGMLLAAGFETTSQFSALLLAGEANPWLLGAVFTGGMVLVDGLDGYLAASTQFRASTGERNAQNASRLLGILIVIFSFGLGGLELFGFEWKHLALPLGLALFATVITIRIWARSGSSSLLHESVLAPSQFHPATQ